MKNMIMIWSGAVVDIPAGWALCDGNNGTPDLRGKFVIGAGGAYAPGDTGGSINHNHTFTGDGHTHPITHEHDCPGAGVDICLAAEDTESGVAAGTTNNRSSLPPYHALCYIMKVP